MKFITHGLEKEKAPHDAAAARLPKIALRLCKLDLAVIHASGDRECLFRRVAYRHAFERSRQAEFVSGYDERHIGLPESLVFERGRAEHGDRECDADAHADHAQERATTLFLLLPMSGHDASFSRPFPGRTFREKGSRSVLKMLK
jgi:hypothetical protein